MVLSIKEDSSNSLVAQVLISHYLAKYSLPLPKPKTRKSFRYVHILVFDGGVIVIQAYINRVSYCAFERVATSAFFTSPYINRVV